LFWLVQKQIKRQRIRFQLRRYGVKIPSHKILTWLLFFFEVLTSLVIISSIMWDTKVCKTKAKLSL
jgi:hypothetical protein